MSLSAKKSKGTDIRPEGPGPYPEIQSVTTGSVPERAGFQVGDTLVSVNGRDAREHPLFPDLAAGAQYRVLIRRNGVEHEVGFTLAGELASTGTADAAERSGSGKPASTPLPKKMSSTGAVILPLPDTVADAAALSGGTVGRHCRANRVELWLDRAVTYRSLGPFTSGCTTRKSGSHSGKGGTRLGGGTGRSPGR